MATSWEELTHWKRLWCWEGLGAGGEGDNRGWDGWMASLTQWTWVWVNSGSWWWTGRPGVLQSTGFQRVGHNWVAELNCTELNKNLYLLLFSHLVVSDFLWSCGLQNAGFLSFILCPSFLKYISFESVMLSYYLILCCPLLLLPSIFPSIRVFSNELALCIRWSKYWSFSFSSSPSNEYSGLISFRMDWLDLLTVQGTLKSVLQYRSSKASILWCSAFFMAQFLHPYMTTGKTIALTRHTCVGKVMSAFSYAV